MIGMNDRDAEIVRRYLAGERVVDIMKAFHIGGSSTYKVLHAAGVMKGRIIHYTKPQYTEIHRCDKYVDDW